MRLIPEDRVQRWLAVGNLVNMAGTGAALSTLVVFLARAKHLELSQAAALLSVSGLIGVLGAVPLGQLSDRYGPRSVAIGTELTCAAATCALLLAWDVWVCALALTVKHLATSGNTAARATLMGKLVPPERRTALRAYQRSVTNVGFALGALGAGPALASGSTTALYALLAADAVTFCLSAFATARLPQVSRGAHRRRLAADALSDRGYLSMAVLNAAHTLNRAIVSIGVPLWVVYGSPLPHWAVSAAMMLNTSIIVVLQVPLSKQAEDIRGSRRALLIAGLCTAVGCGMFAVGGILSTAAVWPLFVVACLALAFGEILGAAAGWTLSYDLAPDDMLGQYQGVWQLVADGSSKAAGPAVIGWAVAAGALGWSALAAGFTAVSVVSPAAAGWASTRTRRHRAARRAEPWEV
ncbi:MFS transporter [Sphaerisporangium melleum]|uniref:MFS transporter n=1 Tax=Sphaerisporangium melleum TaxID=321316 RepID=A0A917RFS5_9ACTN|nr:MFS transporter [Sphaerisporangium melleum]GGL05198.1 MFS transporter [Sphaerisporangium melleum]GII73920.1 MFS transporter [Sphaerisporangium melleum]